MMKQASSARTQIYFICTVLYPPLTHLCR